MVRLPHPELAGLVEAVKRHLVGRRVASIAGTEVPYSVFRSGEEAPDVAFYDEGGAIYVSEDLVDEDGRVADLTVYHEHVEIRHKRAGRSHAYARRWAYVEELLAAKDLFGGPGELRRYLRRRMGGYPEWKVPDPDAVAERLHGILSVEKPLRGELLRAITEHRL
ncbi:MAG: hypothetical protein M3P51_10970 [Chloroflexota bacterium]|nr:hypothetical protein [Chloroflexota bacterium]